MEALLEAYRTEAAIHGRGSEEGDSKKTNAAYDRLVELASEIINSDGANGLFSLFSDSDPWVQLWAAGHALELNEVKAVAKLQEISAGCSSPLASFCARHTIQSWEKGGLKRLRR